MSRVVKVDLTVRNAQGVPRPAPEHLATIKPPRREKRARESRRRLADIPDAGARTSALAKLWSISARAAAQWLTSRALAGKVACDRESGVMVWRRS